MKTLFDEIEDCGFHVIHNKTDSVKVPNATIDIIRHIQEFARKYGYEMDHEATYERMCLIDKAQYVAAYMRPERCEELYGYIPGDNAEHFAEHSHPWTTTGDEFQRPYIFKTLFSGEPIEFDDCCETNTVKDAAIYLDMNECLPDVSLYEKELDRRVQNASGSDKKMKLNPDFAGMSDLDIQKAIDEGHDYHFVGRVGRFYPIRPGAGGGLLRVLRNGKYSSVSGSKGYRWLEAEVVKDLHKESEIDPAYHDGQVNEAIAAINKFGSFERFVDTSKPYISIEEAERRTEDMMRSDDDPPWTEVPCEDGKYNTCYDCPNCVNDICRRGYSLASYMEEGKNDEG